MKADVRPITTLRTAQAADVAAISAVDVAAWKKNYAPLMPLELIESWLVRIPYIWRRGLEGKVPHYVVRVAEQEGRIVGFFAAERARLWTLQVDPEHEHHGVGRVMFDDAVELCGQGIFTHVLRENRHACEFFEHRGLRPIAEIKDVYLDMEVPVLIYGR